MSAKPSLTQRISPSELSIEPFEDGFIVMYGDSPVLTPAGDKVFHKEPEVLQHILNEFDAFSKIGIDAHRIVEPQALTAFTLYGVQKEVIEKNSECLSLHFNQCLRGDGIFYPAPGPHESMAQQSRWHTVYQWMNELGLKLPSLLQYWGDAIENPEEDEDFQNNRDAYVPSESFSTAIENIYKSMSAEQRAAVYVLHGVHACVMFPLVLALGKCTPNEYASGVLAVHGVVAEDWSAMAIPDAEHYENFQQYRDTARVVTEWLTLFTTRAGEASPEEALIAEIQQGESTKREFKSSLRWHIHKKQNDEVITHSVLKTIAAFLNTDGGTLLIGVEDNGTICGIEHDGFKNDDKFLLHLFNYIQDWLGNQHAARIKVEMIDVKGKKVCRVECQAFAGEWAYLRRKGDEEFLVRVGPSSKPLKPSEIATYMASHKK